ncbi:Spy/CpxP family protein refolding chaperone [Thermostichus vulcanus]|uniref:Periplasmic heavy metal sensor n=1 Tax=Thermostichus vulcanus str. 'Rupite' TaxID=2813851 RepID=A0ABT0C8D8_THEVL|nr:periplasmic heavy metal sensor [Thermostichus vulcanus]MCJ2542053.1 periplasmic heavy metal sensor [Thermostichus vulcanus str. 'Rupite']
MKRTLVWIPLLSLGLLYLGAVNQSTVAQPSRPRVTELRRNLRDLNLSAEQLRQLQQIRHRKQEELLDRTLELRTARRQLRELLVSDAPESEVEAQFQRVQRLAQEVNASRFEAVLEMRQVLSPEQRQQLLQAIEDLLPL